MKPIGSVITTSQGEANSKIGTPLGAHGLTMRSDLEIATRLASNDPVDMDKKAASLARSCGVGLRVEYKTIFKDGRQFDSAKGCIINGTDEQRQEALQKLLVFQTPPPKETIEEWLAELSVITAGRGESGMAAELQLSVYSSRLAKFPADVVRYALLKHPWKWFPAWADLESICNAKAAPRRHMIDELRKPQPKPKPEWKPPTPEEKQRMKDFIAENFPDVPQEWKDAAERELSKSDNLKR